MTLTVYPCHGRDCDIGAPDAWDTFTGSSDIVVVVIDSGMALTHEDFMGNNRASEGNKQIKVFVNKKLGEELYEARDENYNIVLINGNEKILGKNIKVKIKDVGVHHMVGEMF